jgi:hypothetical protein
MEAADAQAQEACSNFDRQAGAGESLLPNTPARHADVKKAGRSRIATLGEEADRTRNRHVRRGDVGGLLGDGYQHHLCPSIQTKGAW